MPRSRRALLSAALLAGLSGPALAHAHLEKATPAAGARLATAPGAIDLVFSEGLNLAFSGVRITGPNGAAVATGPAALQAGGDTTLVVPLPGPLPAGDYAVDWHALATDGHKTTGHYVFTLAP